MIAALYVEKDGTYYGLEGVDPWDEERDARTYPGPFRVVAHPPCNRWSIIAPSLEVRFGYKVGDDGGCFAAALEAVRTWGGVLEHPALTRAWAAFGIPRPPKGGGWAATLDGGWTCEVEQGWYGHEYRKPTWLYLHGVDDPPPLRWGPGPGKVRPHRGDHGLSEQARKKVMLPTPPEFRELLLRLARGQ